MLIVLRWESNPSNHNAFNQLRNTWLTNLRSGTIKGFSILEDQINLARDFKDKLSKFRSSLTLTRAFLQDAEKRQLDELVKFWLEQLRDIAYEANDVLDELAYEHVRWKVDNQMSKK
ncbi:hypothetical protein ES319_A10G156500v1 [Gossypium barbadense]|nr:hypothetical protein ES319_A10G156500v1 [Gossypium barbadense]